VLTEGVVPYLSNHHIAALAEELKSLDRVAYWVVDYFSAAAIHQRPRQMQHKMRNAPFKFAPGNWTAFFEKRGWQVQELRYFCRRSQSAETAPLNCPCGLDDLRHRLGSATPEAQGVQNVRRLRPA